MPDIKESSRYPYTYASDWIRGIAGYNAETKLAGTKLSRSDASMIRSAIADVICMDDHELACKLADQELKDKCRVLPDPTHRLIGVYILNEDGSKKPANMSIPETMYQDILKASKEMQEEDGDYMDGWDHDPNEVYKK